MDASTYQLPGHNAVTLSDELTKEIRLRFKRDRDNRFKLFLLSQGIRQRYLDPVSNEYPPEFHDWYANSGVAELFGKLPNFTRYAAAGEAIDYVAKETAKPKKYLAQLPTSMNALYEVAQIIKLDAEAFTVCLHFTPSRKTLDAPKHEWRTKNTSPLIQPSTTAKELSAWRKRWEEPEQNKEEDKYRRNVNLLTVSISEDIFGFDDVGNKTGIVDMEHVQSLLGQIEALFSKSNEKQFKLDTKIDRIKEKYQNERDKRDPSVVLKSAKKSRSDDYT